MKANYFKGSLMLACLALAMSVPAQQTTSSSVVKTQKDNTRKEQIVTNKNGKSYQLELVEDKITLLKVDGVPVPEEKWGDYNTLITELKEQLKHDREQADKDREQADLDRIQAEKDRAQAVRDREQAKLDRAQADKDRQQAIKDREQADRDRAQAEKDRLQAEKDREQAALDRVKAAQDRKLLTDMTNDLINDKLIPDTKELHELTLNNNEMTVNGQKQPESVVKKYQEKYSRFANGGMTYSSDGNNKRFSITNSN